MFYFADYFKIDEATLDKYGAFNISLVNDLPLFIDPFLLFGSSKPVYKQLHNDILKYLTFLKSKSTKRKLTTAEIDSWYRFPEVRQNWLGYSRSGNYGQGLGRQFGDAMSENMGLVFGDLNREIVTATSHLEKAMLFQIGVGKDNISDFTTNLIKSFLLEYTERFTRTKIDQGLTRIVNVNKVYFDYKFERWMPKAFTLPFYNDDYVILTPNDILTKDDNWINGHDLTGNFDAICSSIPNAQLRLAINQYLKRHLPAPKIVGKGKRQHEKKPSQKDLAKAVNTTVRKFPIILDYYIKSKEENPAKAKSISKENVEEVAAVFKQHIVELINYLKEETGFYDIASENSLDESKKRVEFLKDFIENKDGYRIFYYKGKPIKREAHLQLMYRLTWYATELDVNREVNNGRGPVDYKVSKGAFDNVLVEFKLAGNKKLKQNLENQVKIYEKANSTNKSLKVIMYFDNSELLHLRAVLKELKLDTDESIILIDAGKKPSASNVK